MVELTPDGTPPRLRDTFPAARAILGSAHSIHVVFNEPQAASRLSPGSLSLTEAGADGVHATSDDARMGAGTIEYRETLNAVVLRFSENLPPGYYRAELSPPIYDAAGNAQMVARVWVF